MVVGKNFLIAETLGEVVIGLDAAIAEERPPAAYLLRAATIGRYLEKQLG